MKRTLFSILIIVSVSLSAIGISRAFFSDTETSSGNTFTAGSVDLKIDNESYYNGVFSETTSWDPTDLVDELFFDFTDIKPSDWGEDTISLRVDSNDAWLCADIDVTSDDDNDCTEPELLDDPECTPNGDLFDGEIGALVNMVFWVDDGDNVLESNEVASIFENDIALNVLTGKTWALAHSSQAGRVLLDSDLNASGAMIGGQTYYIGKYWCFGSLEQDPVPEGEGIDPTVDSGFDCDGAALDNAAQTDSLLADISFRAEQARHNPSFLCSGEEPSPSPTPTPTACGQADVMLVLDRSGSISAGELTDLKTAAQAFVTALGLSTDGIHAGQSSFASTATLDHHLTDNAASLNVAISALASGGFTNLVGGINQAIGELDNAHVHERAAIPDSMIVITDGHPNVPPGTPAQDAADAADAARLAGIEVFVVGVGSNVNTTYLQDDIADDAGHYYSASNYSGLEQTLDDLDLCEE